MVVSQFLLGKNYRLVRVLGMQSFGVLVSNDNNNEYVFLSLCALKVLFWFYFLSCTENKLNALVNVISM